MGFISCRMYTWYDLVRSYIMVLWSNYQTNASLLVQRQGCVSIDREQATNGCPLAPMEIRDYCNSCAIPKIST